MTGSPETPDSRENAAATPQLGPPYPYPPDYPLPPVAPKNGLGIASLVLAVIGLVSVATVFVPIILGVAAVAIGVLGRSCGG